MKKLSKRFDKQADSVRMMAPCWCSSSACKARCMEVGLYMEANLNSSIYNQSVRVESVGCS